ncbi:MULTISPECIES: hypothetical protein [unclassified Beijerinckia]|uniref:hypothetical protein n=1 Tax=unclassified Beijerinckia TaxID=2638183 RepID=UPI000895FEA3|nr:MULTISPECIES: hypothetical protein [unclassified Beijerinckia]MDH7798802.1 chromosome segregation ATPase [Beijerinckia sp. GAS462]SED33744.1 hypothetical protein SAMN05443249_5104 [Beijerinckia sp. 28-YEA-48]
MIFALGFLFAGLLTLLFLPAFWRRALRLSTRRLEMQMPLSMTEIVAERDQLRAEFATATRRIEQKNEHLSEVSAVQQAQMGRQGTTIVDLEAKLLAARQDIDGLRAELATSDRLLQEAQGELGALSKEVFDVTGLADRRGAALGDLESRHATLEQIANEQRASLGALDTRVSGLEMELEDARRHLSASQLQLTDKIAAAELLTREREAARFDASAAHAKRNIMQSGLDEAIARLEAMENQDRAGQRARSRLVAQLAEQQETIDALNARESALRQAADAHGRGTKEVERLASERLQAARAERDALQGAIDTLRKDNRTMRQELAALRQTAQAPAVAAIMPASVAVATDGEALLRQTIAEIGAEVTRIASTLEAQQAAQVQAAQAQAEDKNGTAELGEGADPLPSVAERIRALQAVGRPG